MQSDKKCPVKLERQVNNIDQNNRKNNIEINDIPSLVYDNQLREVVADLLNRTTDQPICTNDVEAIHRLFSKCEPKPTIMRMQRNLLEEIMSKMAKAKLKGFGISMECSNGTKIYINDHLSLPCAIWHTKLVCSRIMMSLLTSDFLMLPLKSDKNRGNSDQNDPLRAPHLDIPDINKFTFDRSYCQSIVKEEEPEAYDDYEGWNENEKEEKGEDDADDNEEKAR